VTKNNVHIVTKENKTYTGVALLPKNTTKKVITEINGGQRIEINSIDIDYILVGDKKKNPEKGYKLIYTSINEYKSKKEDGNLEMKTENKPRWIAHLTSRDNISLYMECEEYGLNKDGYIVGISKSSGGIYSSAWYYLMREGEDMPTRIGDNTMGGEGNSYFRVCGQKYFADCPMLVEQIKNKKLRQDNFEEILIFYSDKCK
jgi:hypothetical protein